MLSHVQGLFKGIILAFSAEPRQAITKSEGTKISKKTKTARLLSQIEVKPDQNEKRKIIKI